MGMVNGLKQQQSTCNVSQYDVEAVKGKAKPVDGKPEY